MPSEESCHSTKLSIDPIQSNLGRWFDQNEWKSEQKHHHSSKQISSHPTSHQRCSHLKSSYGIKPDVGNSASKILGHQRNDNREGRNTILHDMQTNQQANVSAKNGRPTGLPKKCFAPVFSYGTGLRWSSSHKISDRFNISSRKAMDCALYLRIHPRNPS